MDEILREARGDRLFPGDGEIDLTALLHRLPGLPLSLEVPVNAMRGAGTEVVARARMAIVKTRTLLRRAEAHG